MTWTIPLLITLIAFALALRRQRYVAAFDAGSGLWNVGQFVLASLITAIAWLAWAVLS